MHVDAQVGEHPLGDVAVLGGTFDRFRPTVGDEATVADHEFVALGVPSEVVVIVEQQDLRASPRDWR